MKRERSAQDWSAFGQNAWLVEEQYQRYLADPESVEDEWRAFFDRHAPADGGDGAARPAPASGQPPRVAPPKATPVPRPAPPSEEPPPTAAARAPAQRDAGADVIPLRSVAGVIARRMEESLAVPTATSFRSVPAKLLEVNRTILNNHLARMRGGKVSFTHLIAFAIARALAERPAMNTTYREIDGKPHAVRHPHVNLGLAVDLSNADGSRTLVVPTIKAAEEMTFDEFLDSYEELIGRAHAGSLRPDDFTGTTVTITNPGTLGTAQSVPRLMAGQAAIIGVGAIGFPPEFAAADPRALAELGVGKVFTLTSTYDHRVIQGAESGEFLGRVHALLLGGDGFYDDVFRSMGVRYVPVRWRTDSHPANESLAAEEKRARVLQLINMYRVRGHLIAQLDPLEAEPPRMHPELEPATYGFTIWDLDRTFPTGDLAGRKQATLSEILGILRDAYCRTAAVEYMHIQEPDQKRWIQEQIEGVASPLTHDDRRQILHKLNQAEVFERFLHRTYLGHKRFSLEGAETLIPMLDAILDAAGDTGLDEVVIGMAHRGRLNVLANTIGKSYEQVFREFEGNIDPFLPQGSGDVKYHIGADGKHTSRAGAQIKVSVASNPSHLESVDPVVEGVVRAKQDLLDRGQEFPVLPVLIHGDAAFAGQGVVAETLNLSQLSGYRTGGTVHIIVNNQLGYTTGWHFGRSSTYATDVAKMIQAPIFHVNGDDPEACVRVARLAYDFRRRFNKDVVIDMWCYRRWGHNETDDPALTQPLMYRRIEQRASIRERYSESVVARGVMTADEVDALTDEFRASLEEAFEIAKAPSDTPAVEWKPPAELGDVTTIETAVERAQLDEIVEAITTIPEGFTVHRLLNGWLRRRTEALAKDAVDWSLAEALAFGSLLMDGTTIRVSGQDTRRGTFSQRHSVLVDQQTGDEFCPFLQIPRAAGKFLIYDSLLSEFAALGFEYGYSVAHPSALVVWEAQFGDFANGAQVIIDAYLAAAEDKWEQRSGLVMLLPHGYEGQGPEHSSARLERYLSLAAEDNFQVCVPGSPAQYFHLLRRQVQLPTPKPLIVMTPKALMRDTAFRSPTDAFTDGRFELVLDDPVPPRSASRVLLCSGKVFYDLVKLRAERGIGNVALVRVEQLYPFPADELRAVADRYGGAEIVWVQEEPVNMGAANFMVLNARRALGVDLRVIGRPESASTATGSLRVHEHEHAILLDQAFAELPN